MLDLKIKKGGNMACEEVSEFARAEYEQAMRYWDSLQLGFYNETTGLRKGAIMEFIPVIEQGIAVTKQRRGAKARKYAFLTRMNIGDSVFLPFSFATYKAVNSAVQVYKRQEKKQYRLVSFAVRKATEEIGLDEVGIGVRVWRIK